MELHTHQYILRCVALGILTDKSPRKYPLRAANLALVLKAYAIAMHLPYTINNQRYDLMEGYTYYLTEGGYEWLMNFFQQYSLPYLRSTFHFLFANATKVDIDNPEQYQAYNNFRGTVGERPKAGTKQKAVLVRTYKNMKKEYHFDTIAEARQELLMLTRYFPLNEFTLYRVRKNTRAEGVTYYRSEIPLLIEKSGRGTAVNLPHVRGQL